MDTRVNLDLGKLIMAGQSFGGATALRVGNSERRVKGVLLQDPWLAPLSDEIYVGSFDGFSED